MEESNQKEVVKRDAPQLAALLAEMKEGLDTVRSKIELLTANVKENNFPTTDGISYLEAKNLLLLNYCQSIVYYLLRKAKGFSVEGHPVVRSLVEIRLFLEKVRPIDKKLDYQIQKLLKVAKNSKNKEGDGKLKANVVQTTDDLLRYRPNPDMLVPKITNTQDGNAVYKPPFLARDEMEEMLDDKISKQEKLAMRREKQMLRQSKESSYVRRLMNDLEGKPEEVTDSLGAESREMTRYKEKRERQEQQEEDLFTRAPVSRADKKREKHLLSSRNGLLGLTDGFEDEIRTLGFEDDDGPSRSKNSSRGKKFNKHKRKRG